MSFAKLPKEEIELFKQLPDLRVIFDVGSRDDTEYYDIYPNAEYHLFEPNIAFIKNLIDKVGDKLNVHINPYGLGDSSIIMGYDTQFQSFIGGENPIQSADTVYLISTLDNYVKENNISQIDFLKIDAEGYDFRVLLGALSIIPKTRFIQYEHWDDKKEFHTLLGESFDMEYVGYRNVLCMNKVLVDVRTRNRIREFIEDNNYKKLK